MESITKPVIGIVFCGFSDDRLFVPFSYIQAIEKSDGIPVIIPYLSDADSLSSYLSICDGFLFCGGDDITPELFGEELQTDHGTTDRKTDQFHLTLMQKVLDFHLPVLGICRGMQVLNLTLGGTIYQDLSLP
ncbi:MAG: gamma-glutamyl-gamma-aminobutyrate hydrolase family protein [Lachnospiraceae bacterium]